MLLMCGLRMHVGIVFVRHVHQLQVGAAMLMALSARVPEFGNCWGWTGDWVEGLLGWMGGSLRQQTPSPCYLD